MSMEHAIVALKLRRGAELAQTPDLDEAPRIKNELASRMLAGAETIEALSNTFDTARRESFRAGAAPVAGLETENEELLEQRDAARRIAVQLEQELAHLEETRAEDRAQVTAALLHAVADLHDAEYLQKPPTELAAFGAALRSIAATTDPSAHLTAALAASSSTSSVN
jgi:hypothetical protein